MVMFKEMREETIWELWISNPFRENSFDDFKAEINRKTEDRSLSKSEKEAKALEGMNSALAMLGGDFIGN